MSDYFGALLRSSRMAVGGAASAAAAPQAAATDTVAIDVERAAPPMQAQAVQYPPAPRAATEPPSDSRAPAPFASRSAEMAPLPSQIGPDRQHMPSFETDGDGTAHVQPIRSDASQALRSSPAAERNPAATEPPLGQALVHAAMRWVAADPQQPTRVPELADRREPSSAIIEESRSTIASLASHDADGEPQTAPARPLPVRTPARDLEEAPATSRRSAVAAMAIAPAVVPAVRGELVDVTIGAIHVRVDAPAPRTVARAPAPSQAAAQRSTAAFAPERSGLSRRALRRI